MTHADQFPHLGFPQDTEYFRGDIISTFAIRLRVWKEDVKDIILWTTEEPLCYNVVWKYHAQPPMTHFIKNSNKFPHLGFPQDTEYFCNDIISTFAFRLQVWKEDVKDIIAHAVNEPLCYNIAWKYHV